MFQRWRDFVPAMIFPACWLAVAGLMILGGCSPEAIPDSARTTAHTGAKMWTNEAYCELGTPGYEGDCDDPGTTGYGGQPWQACPYGLPQDACQTFDATLDAMINSGDSACALAGNMMQDGIGNSTVVFDNVHMLDPITGDPMAAGTRPVGGYSQTTFFNDAFNFDYDPYFTGAAADGGQFVNFNLANTIAHEATHRAGDDDDDDADWVGDYCEYVVRSNELARQGGPALRAAPRSGTMKPPQRLPDVLEAKRFRFIFNRGA